MCDRPWLSFVGIGEDGLEGLGEASRKAIEAADVVMAPSRHLELVQDVDVTKVTWPVPFSDGIPVLLGLKGQNVVLLVSGDPFWFGAGSVVTKYLCEDEWQAYPNLSCFSLMANRVGWALEKTVCLGLHAVPVTRLRPYLSNGKRLIVTLRDGNAVSGLVDFLDQAGFGGSKIHIGQSLGSQHECISTHFVHACEGRFKHPLCAAIDLNGPAGLPLASGLADDLFYHDGQITKRPMRALALSALAPRHGELLWDIGGGSGSIAIEWLLRHESMRAICVEKNPVRSKNIAENACHLGVDRLEIVTGSAPDALVDLEKPDVVFIGGGLSVVLLERLKTILPIGTRIGRTCGNA